MPMLKAQQHPDMFGHPPAGLYHFNEIHRDGWRTFWKEMDGDVDKILKWADAAGIEDSKIWYQELHKFLFDFYSGDTSLIRKAAKGKFVDYIAQVTKNHINDPKPGWWYNERGVNYEKFISILQRSVDSTDERSVIYFLNARLVDFGFNLYSEYLLSKTGYEKSMQSIASNMRKKAYDIEQSICGEYEDLEEGDIIRHANFPGETFQVLEVADGVTVTADKDGLDCYVTDPWNVELVS